MHAHSSFASLKPGLNFDRMCKELINNGIWIVLGFSSTNILAVVSHARKMACFHVTHTQTSLFPPFFLLVLAVKTITKKRSIQGQTIMQARRKDVKDANGQQWEWVQSIENNHEEQAGDQDKDGGDGGGSISNDDCYYLQLKAFSDYYLNDKDVPTFGDNKIKWAIV